MNIEILHDLIITSTSEKIFEYIVTPNHLNNWWTLESEGIPSLKDDYTFYFAPEFDWKATVSGVEVNKWIEFKMKKCSKGWEGSYFGFDISPHEQDTCLLSFYHRGWKENSHDFRRTSFCWALLLYDLKNYIEHGTIVPFEKRDRSN